MVIRSGVGRGMSEEKDLRCPKWKCYLKPCDEKCTKDCPIYRDNYCTDCTWVDDCLNAEFERSKV